MNDFLKNKNASTLAKTYVFDGKNTNSWFKLVFICIIYDKSTKQHRIRLLYNHYTNGIQKKVK